MSGVEININKNTYAFIDPNNGQEIPAEEFAKKYPAVGLGRLAVGLRAKEDSEASKKF